MPCARQRPGISAASLRPSRARYNIQRGTRNHSKLNRNGLRPAVGNDRHLARRTEIVPKAAATEARTMRPGTTRRGFMRETSMTAALSSLAMSGRGTRGDGGTAYLCVTCGTQFPESPKPPDHCAICEDERQYVGPDGQEWTTLERLRTTHKNTIKHEEEHLYSISTEPKFGIGQRAFLIQTPRGNLLWDCVGLIDDPTVSRIKELGGIAEIAISHPHYYTSMVEWSRAFGDAPIHIHEAERPWVMRPDPCVRYWKGENQTLLGSLPLVRTGGHFEGYQVLLWPAGAGGAAH